MTAQLIKAQVEHIKPLTDSVMHLILAPERYIDYAAGQYLQILVDEEALCYSIANAPLGSHKYELHIRHTAENHHNQRLFREIKERGEVQLRVPYGGCTVDALEPSRPIIFIAGGTGFAPVNAMIEQLLIAADTRTFELYWGARSKSDVYLNESIINWHAHIERFQHYSLVTSEQKDGLLSALLARHQGTLGQWQFVLSGPFDMVYSIRDSLLAEGVPQTQLFSDAFT
jgi:CDP-4-dehydro-6-deoxyglucose reductase